MRIRTMLRDAARVFRTNPGFAAVIVLTLGLGIGANSAIFSLINGVLLQPLPYGSGAALVRVRMGPSGPAQQPGNLSPLEVVDVRERARALDGVVEYHTMFFNLLEREREPERVQVGVVSWDFFPVLGVQPLHGRTFTPEEDRIGAEPVLVLGYDYWLTRFGGDPAVVGRSVEMNNRPHRIVGVLPSVPTYPNQNDVWMPWYACPFRVGDGWHLNRQARSLLTVARVAEGASVDAAAADLDRVAHELHAEHGDAYPGVEQVDAELVPLKEELTAEARPTFLILLAMAGLVLLIACANVTNLTLARLNQRQSELAVRAALGASQRRLLGQLVGESVLLALCGALVGVAMAYGSVGLLREWASALSPRFNEVRVDGWVLGFTALVALVVGVVIGGVPGFQARRLAATLREQKASGTRTRHRVSAALVVAQVGVAFVLLTGSALMVRSFSNLVRVDPGYDARDVLTVTIDLDWATYVTNEDSRAFYRALLPRLRARPGVQAVAAASDFPMSGATFQTQRRILAQGATDTDAPPQVNARFVTDGYFETLGIPILSGRAFEARDDAQAAPVAIVSRAAAQRLFPGRDAIGGQISPDNGTTWLTVVGIAADVRQAGFEADLSEEVYFAFEQSAYQSGFARRVLIRTAGIDPMTLARAVTEDVYAVDPDQPVSFVQTLEDAESDRVASPRTIAVLLGIFALVALVTAAAGLLSVIALSTAERRREIGIRLALGGQRRDVVLMVVRHGVALTVGGLVLGAVLSLAVGGMLESLLFGLDARDPLTLVGVATGLFAAAALATWVPAWRGTAVDPVEAVRE